MTPFSCQTRTCLGAHTLGVMYQSGSGVEQNYIRAHIWLSLNNESGYGDAREDLGTLTKLMTPQQIKEARKLGQKCQIRQLKEYD